MIQVIIVLVIVAVLVAIAANVIPGARRSGQKRQAVEAARTLADAVDQFRLDHGERPPQLSDAKDWPTPARGPINSLTGQRYMKVQPDALGSNWLALGTSLTGAQWNLVYRATNQAPHGFRIDVIYQGSTARPSCTITVDRAPASIVANGGALAPC